MKGEFALLAAFGRSAMKGELSSERWTGGSYFFALEVK